MSQPLPSINIDDQYVHNGSSRPRSPGAPVLKYSADFFPVPSRIEKHEGEEYTTTEVSTCLFEEPLSVNSAVAESEDSRITWDHADLARKVMQGVRCWEFVHGFWRVDEALFPDGGGYVKVCEFGDLSFDISVPARLQGRCFDIGTKDVAHVLTSIWNEMRDYYRGCQPGGAYSILKPPFWGTLLCKGCFDQGPEASAHQQVPVPTQGEFSLYWRVQESSAASHLRHQADLELQDMQNAAGNHGHGGQHEGPTGPGVAAGDHHARQGVSEGSWQSLGVSGSLGRGARHRNISSSRAWHPGS